MHNWSAADRRSSGRAIPNEVKFRLNAMPRYEGPPTYQMTFGPNPADLHIRRGGNSDSDFAQDASMCVQFVKQRK